MVTARFCQLNTGESDACQILRTKLNLPPPGETQVTQGGVNGNNNNNGRRLAQQKEEDEFYCSNCYTDNCNGVSTLVGSVLLTAVMIVPVQQMISRLW